MPPDTPEEMPTPPPPPPDGELRFDEVTRKGRADDFGHIVHQMPEGVLLPGSADDVASLAPHGVTSSPVEEAPNPINTIAGGWAVQPKRISIDTANVRSAWRCTARQGGDHGTTTFLGSTSRSDPCPVRGRLLGGVDMGLTDEERRRLDELADELSREDPRLGQALTSRTRWRWLSAVGVLLAVVSLPLAVLGVSLEQPLLFAAGSTSLVVAVWIGLAGEWRRRRSDSTIRERPDRRAIEQ